MYIESEMLRRWFRNVHVIPIIKKGLEMYFILLKALLPPRVIDFALLSRWAIHFVYLFRWAIHFGFLPRWAVNQFWLDQLLS